MFIAELSNIELMSNIQLSFKNCYGIFALEHELDFSKNNIVAIYASNGVMKTSFSNTIKDYAEGRPAKDHIFEDRKSEFVIKSNNKAFDPKNIFTYSSISKEYSSPFQTNLLINSKIKKRYDKIAEEIMNKSGELASSIKEYLGYARKRKFIVEEELLKVFGSGGTFLDLLKDLEPEVIKIKSPNIFTKEIIDELFNEKVIRALKSGALSADIAEYEKMYTDLLSKSNFFSNKFDHYNANQVQDSLNANNYFEVRFF